MREREREFILDNIHYFTLKINYGVVLTSSIVKCCVVDEPNLFAMPTDAISLEGPNNCEDTTSLPAYSEIHTQQSTITL